jgi:hypothetical protein
MAKQVAPKAVPQPKVPAQKCGGKAKPKKK